MSDVQDPQVGAALELVGSLPRRFSDTARSMAFALPAVDLLNETADDGEGDETDSELVLLPGILAVGPTPGAALRRAAAFCDKAPHLNVDSVTLARMPGPVIESWEFHITVVFAASDPADGESSGSTHHGYPPAKGERA